MLAVEDRQDGSLIGMLGLTTFGAALKATIPSHPELQIAGIGIVDICRKWNYTFHVSKKRCKLWPCDNGDLDVGISGDKRLNYREQ
jgi:hypothetical protein